MTYNKLNDIHMMGECGSRGRSDMFTLYNQCSNDFQSQRKFVINEIDYLRMCNTDRFFV